MISDFINDISFIQLQHIIISELLLEVTLKIT